MEQSFTAVSRLIFIQICVIFILFFGLSSCKRNDNGQADEQNNSSRDLTIELRIAEQNGLAYLPLALLQTENILQSRLNKDFPEARIKISWVRLGNAAAIREAMLAGRLDIGFMGIPPFLIGLDRGTPWKLLCGLSETPLGMVTLKDNLNDLSDFSSNDRIALPQPGSIQHILLSMAAERQLGDPRLFDNQLISMAHPEGMTAMLSGRNISAHFTSPPFLSKELDEPNAKLVLSGQDAFQGRFTFIIGVAGPDWRNSPKSEELQNSFMFALEEAIALAEQIKVAAITDDFTEQEIQEAVAELSEYYNQESSQLLSQLKVPGIIYSTEVYGMEKFIQAMNRFGYVDEKRVRNNF